MLRNAPGERPGSWGRVLLGLEAPIDVAAGGTVEGEIGTEITALGDPGWLRWSVTAAGHTVRGHEFGAEPASLGDLLAASPEGVPVLDARGALEREVLRLTDGRRSADHPRTGRKQGGQGRHSG